MDRVKGITKNGYHPTGKDGGKESWRGDHKGINQVATWVGKGKNPNDIRSPREHSSQPLSSLRDPDSFGPPPKNLNFHGAAAASPTTPVAAAGPHRALGAPLPPEADIARRVERNEQQQTSHRPAPPPLPHRADSTGLDTSNLPKPPVRRLGNATADPRSPTSPASVTKPPKPNLPPRLPPRQNSNPLQTAPVDPPPTYATATQEQQEWGQQNRPPPPAAKHNIFATQQGALSRLGSAGVKVPALGIGKTSSPTPASDNPWADESPAATSNNDNTSHSLSGISSRFSSLSTNASPPPASSAPSSTGTTWAEKQAAMKTASSFRNDPSSVSLADAKATASTANNFRERHGDQVAQGWKVGNGLNQKYGIADRVGAAAGSPAAAEHSPRSPSGGAQANPWAGAVGAVGGINRKPPPPPVPLGSKPR